MNESNTAEKKGYKSEPERTRTFFWSKVQVRKGD